MYYESKMFTHLKKEVYLGAKETTYALDHVEWVDLSLHENAILN